MRAKVEDHAKFSADAIKAVDQPIGNLNMQKICCAVPPRALSMQAPGAAIKQPNRGAFKGWHVVLSALWGWSLTCGPIGCVGLNDNNPSYPRRIGSLAQSPPVWAGSATCAGALLEPAQQSPPSRPLPDTAASRLPIFDKKRRQGNDRVFAVALNQPGYGAEGR
jgi:hypothetical protein